MATSASRRAAADLSDAELRQELFDFGETKVAPVTASTRDILVKKLNHLRAREKSASRQSLSESGKSKRTGNAKSSDPHEPMDTEATANQTPSGKKTRKSLHVTAPVETEPIAEEKPSVRKPRKSVNNPGKVASGATRDVNDNSAVGADEKKEHSLYSRYPLHSPVQETASASRSDFASRTTRTVPSTERVREALSTVRVHSESYVPTGNVVTVSVEVMEELLSLRREDVELKTRQVALEHERLEVERRRLAVEEARLALEERKAEQQEEEVVDKPTPVRKRPRYQ